MADIDLSSYSNWTPIGDHTNPFTGELNGNGFVIDNLSVNGSSGSVGLFSYLSGAYIQNLGIENVNLSGHTGIGALAGNSTHTIVDNVYSTGTINGAFNVGGLIGSFGGRSTIKNSYSDINLTCSYECAGGLVGYFYGSSIENCYTAGSISGGGSTLGGLVGNNNTASIKNSYSLADVSGNRNIGGLAGSFAFSATIENSYALGNVTGNTNVGGLTGSLNQGASIKNSVWNIDKITAGIGDNAGSSVNNHGLTSAEMSDINNFIALGWDETIWDFRPGAFSPPRHRPKSEVDPIRLQIGIDEKSTSVIFVDTNFDLSYFIVDFMTPESCARAIENIDYVLSEVHSKRSEFGALINRLNSILESQTTTIQNFTSAQSTIMDADIAQESADFVKNQILQQTSSALLAQSQNLHASIVLSLIG